MGRPSHSDPNAYYEAQDREIAERLEEVVAMRALHICSFSGAVADLTKREQADDGKVLGALANNPRVSVWDMESAPLRATLERLKAAGDITEEDEPYPWLRFSVACSPDSASHPGGEEKPHD